MRQLRGYGLLGAYSPQLGATHTLSSLPLASSAVTDRAEPEPNRLGPAMSAQGVRPRRDPKDEAAGVFAFIYFAYGVFARCHDYWLILVMGS